MTGYALGDFAVLTHLPSATPDAAAEIEDLGYSALWLGRSPDPELTEVDALLAATTNLTVGTDIVNIWTAPADITARSFHRLDAAHPGRFVLGIGTGHREFVTDYRKPYDATSGYLDELDATGIPQRQRALAAMGPRMLELAKDRTAGSLPYFVPAEHTAFAREILGPAPFLSVGHNVIVADDPAQARALAGPAMNVYLGLTNYVANLRRLGYSDDDLVAPGSTEVFDALTAHGDPATVASKLRRHLDSGADQVALQVISADEQIMPTLRELAPALGII